VFRQQLHRRADVAQRGAGAVSCFLSGHLDLPLRSPRLLFGGETGQ
jgi:hypothetical protein